MTSKRNKTEVTKVGNEPSYLTQYAEDDHSTDGMQEHRVLSRVAIVQGQSPKERKEMGEGSVILTPSMQLICRDGDEFDFVPVFFFSEFLTWSDRLDQNSAMILDRSLDPASELARKARSPDTRREKYGDSYVKRHVEHLNFAGLIYGDHELAMTPIALSFQRGEFAKGQAFVSTILLRKINGRQAPLWSTVWAMRPGYRTNPKGSWWGLDFRNADEPWIAEEHVENFKSLHEELKEAFEQRRLSVDHESAEGSDDENDGAENPDF